MFQAGALLIGERLRKDKESAAGVPVLTRILSAKFKREVRPGDTIELSATLKERVGPAWFCKGAVRVKDKLALRVEFACALKPEVKA